MELNKEYAKNVPEDFFNGFIKEISKYPLGGMSKRDLDCLIFYLLKECELIPGDTNRESAYSLNISESKYKSYLVDSDAKFEKNHDQKASVERIFGKLKDGGSGVSVDGDTLVFFEDDPVVQADFVQDMKSAGFYADTSFNKELIRVKAVSFLLYARKKDRLNDKTVLAIFNKDKADKDKLETFVNSQKTAQDIMVDVFGILKRQENFGIKTIAELFGYAADVAKSKMRSRKDE